MDQQLTEFAKGARAASRPLARAGAEQRTAAIEAMAAALLRERASVEKANAEDLARAKERDLPPAMCDRLVLSGKRNNDLAAALGEIEAMADPVGATTRSWARPNGLRVDKTRLPLGVIMMIYESRPNVTMDAAALCVRSGNAVILRGGSEAQSTNRALATLIEAALGEVGLPPAAACLVPTQDRNAIDELLQMDELIDLVIPRGGEKLIRRVVERSRIPVVQHYKGVCHVYVDGAADFDKAAAIAVNSKAQRPGVCNAMETLLVDAACAAEFLPMVVQRLRAADVEIVGCEKSREQIADLGVATENDWDTEYLSLKMALRVVDGVDGAIAHIDAHGSNHTAAIVTEDGDRASRFGAEVDASCVLLNASTRFNDGGELGLGAEMGISTTRIHAYGPMGVEALTAEKYVVVGDGQVRG